MGNFHRQLVNVRSGDGFGPQKQGGDGQNAAAAAHIQHVHAGKEDISGDPDRAESRTRRAEGFAGRHDRHAESRGTDLYHYISFAGGQDREKRVPQEREPMYLSESFSGLCLWKDIEREGDHKKAHPSVGGRDGGEQPVEECKAEDL